ncbi:MAG: aldehyde dehydrogenase family protein, partial [Syntrophobacter sp.]
SGQKCSATSLLILEREVYEDAGFKRQLTDAARSLDTGSAWDFENRVGPLIRPPEGDLLRGLTQLEPGESWALEPRNVPGNPHLWTPGIKYGVRPGSYTHTTEFFGPVLGVMCAENLDHAVRLANQTGYGLTSGLESLDRSEQERWKAGIVAGNLYINRGTTGAVTLRQPFGGMRKSALGAGIKAGGPDYVSQFMDFEETGCPPAGPVENDRALLRLAADWRLKLQWGRMASFRKDLEKTVRAVESYLYRFEHDFVKEKDYFHLRGQDNLFRYLPITGMVVRLHPEDSLFEALARIAAAKICGCGLSVSMPEEMDGPVAAFLEGKDGARLLGDTPVFRQGDGDLISMMPCIQRIRYAGAERVPAAVYRAAARTGFHIAASPVIMEGRLELLHYFRQQSICDNYHRYGNLGERTFVK